MSINIWNILKFKLFRFLIYDEYEKKFLEYFKSKKS